MKTRKILFVDDEAHILKMLEKSFSREKYDVLTATSGEAALAVLQEVDVHVMVFDLNMPGLSGIELCRQVKHERPMDQVFALTGYASLFELSECREAGFEDYFKKPTDLDMLKDAVHQAFEKRSRWRKG